MTFISGAGYRDVMCQYLDWELNVEPSMLLKFENMVREDFAGTGPYPMYVLQTISKPVDVAAVSTIVLNTCTNPISLGVFPLTPLSLVVVNGLLLRHAGGVCG